MQENVVNEPKTPSSCHKKLQFMALRRSMREMEWLLENFLQNQLQTLQEDDCTRLVALLAHADHDLLAWLAESAPLPADVDREALSWIASYWQMNE